MCLRRRGADLKCTGYVISGGAAAKAAALLFL